LQHALKIDILPAEYTFNPISMQQFKIRPEGYKVIRNKTFSWFIPIMIVALFLVFYTNIYKSEKYDKNSLLFVIPVMLLMMVFILYRITHKQKQLLESYTLTIENNVITREQLNARPVSLYFREVVRVSKLKNNIIVIRGEKPGETIIVPAQIENYGQLEQILQQVKPIDAEIATTFINKYQRLLSVLMVVCMITVYGAGNRILVAIGGIIGIPLLAWSFFEVWKNKDVDARVKRGLLWIWIIIASMIVSMIIKLTGFNPIDIIKPS
jgi:hypothetical protein